MMYVEHHTCVCKHSYRGEAMSPAGRPLANGRDTSASRTTHHVHDGQHVSLDVLVPVVMHHLVIDDDQCLHLALQADRPLRSPVMCGRGRAVRMRLLPLLSLRLGVRHL